MARPVRLLACPECGEHTIPEANKGTFTCSQCLSPIMVKEANVITVALTPEQVRDESREWWTRPRINDGQQPEVHYKIGNYPDSPLNGMNLDEEFGVADLTPKCSFCHRRCSELELTRGKLPTVKFIDMEVGDEDSGFEYVRKPIFGSQKLAACPDCSDMIGVVERTRKVQDEKTGVWREEVISVNITQFPETEG